MKLQLRICLLAGAAVLVLGAPALAQQSVEERLSSMEKRIQYLEQRVADQDKVIVEKDRQIAELSGATEWTQSVQVGGTIEIEGVYEKLAGEDGTSSLGVGTAELGIAAQVNDWAGGELVLAKDDDDKIELDTATITLAPPEGPWSLTAGKLTLPFGAYETALGDPLTLELGETGDTAAVVELSPGGLNASLFGAHGENGEFENFGAAAGFSLEMDIPWEASLDVSASYLNQIRSDAVADSEAFSELPGMTAGAKVSVGGISLIGEYVRAMEEQNGLRPSAWMVEAGYEFDLMGKGAGAAVSYSRTLQAADLDLAETRLLMGVSLELTESVGASLEWQQEEAYDSDDKDSTVTGVLALEF